MNGHIYGSTIRSNDFATFAERVVTHIENYTVPQYGDAGEDQATEYTAEDCVKQAQKYLSRFGKNAREGQQKLDFIKAAHYIQMAYDKHSIETMIAGTKGESQ